ncbi:MULTISPECIES: ABC transporter permease [Pseudanabaena]|uniref:ABC-type transporter, integral membrane subunit n=2 Tax=Pseudanabaena TaxID=1152 RepID=L8N372_9CYAN|nr:MULTISPECIES: ABC transporter permease [Pseudanabaena]ELS33165.1 ABC-type transporter, integral membrane subunit [Pseudanabaena biceps PCC 7429]MDG3494641.1 ABC transporter permease [Pseudanabaena catenata USMAC16]
MTWWKRLRANPLAWIGIIILTFFYAAALFADFMTPYGVNESVKNGALLPPTQIYWHDRQGQYIGAHVYPTTQGKVDMETGDRALIVDYTQPSQIQLFKAGHLFNTSNAPLNLLGTDEQGRDQLTRLLHGGRISLLIGFIGTIISYTIGCLVGGISGYIGGWLDVVLMRFVEVLMSVPSIYLLVALAAILPPQISNTQRFALIIAIISFVSWSGLARIIRGQVLSIKEQTFILAARASGASPLRIIIKHVLPQTITFIIISATLDIPRFIVVEAVLSLVGLGIQPPDPSWGNMLSLSTNASIVILQPWLVWASALAIVLTVLSFNLLGDSLRDALDPKNIRQ